MWPAGQLLPPPPYPIVVPDALPILPDTCLDVDEISSTASLSDNDDHQIAPKRSRVTLERHPDKGPQQGLIGNATVSDLQTPARSPHEPWYLARHDFHPSPLLRPIEIRAFNLLLRPEAPTKKDILQLFGMMPNSHLHSAPAGPYLVSGVSPRSPDTCLTHSSEKYMAKLRPTHLYSTLVICRGVVDRVHRDCRNGPTPSCIVALTDCKQGEGLWVQDSDGQTRLPFQGRELTGKVCNIDQPLTFDARKLLHAGHILPSTEARSRVTLVTFASIHCCTLSEPVRCSLLQLGFPIPSESAIKRALYGCSGCSIPSLSHLRAFVPLAAQEVHDNLHRMPFPIASWFAAELRYVIREYKKSWYWYYNRAHDLWTYLDSLDFILSQYPWRTLPTSGQALWKFGVVWIVLRKRLFGTSCEFICLVGGSSFLRPPSKD